ncbi:hypothetical protein HC928_25160 [bacterium]|nr:hypothetical protein [bacterium]
MCVDKIAQAATLHLDDETGEALAGSSAPTSDRRAYRLCAGYHLPR